MDPYLIHNYELTGLDFLTSLSDEVQGYIESIVTMSS